MTINQLALFGYERSTMLLHLMTDDLAPADWLHHPVPGANNAAWIVGHLLTVERLALSKLTSDLPELPDADFTTRHAKGAKPTPQDDYGDVTRLRPLWDAHRSRLVERVAALPAEEFDRPIEHPIFKTLGQFIGLIPVHTTLHCGQLSTIRRSLGRPAAI